MRTKLLLFAFLMAFTIVSVAAQSGSNTSLQYLLTLASSDVASERLQAAEGLGLSTYPKTATDALLVLLRDKQWFVRLAAADSLRSRADIAVTNDMQHALETETNSTVRDHISSALTFLKAFPANLLASLNATDPLVREKAARDAAYNSDPPIIAALVALLNDPVAKVRETAAESLVNESNPAVIPFEIRTLQSGTDLIARMRAAEALGKLHATSAVDALIAALSDPSPAIWSKAVVALGQIGDPSAAQPIAASMRVFRFSWYDPSLALSKLGEPGLNAILPLLKSNDEWMRILAAQGLQLFKGPRVTTALISALQDPSDAVRGDAAGSLGSIGDPAAVDPLMEALQRPGRSKDAIAAVLGRLGDRRSVPVLIAELHNPISTFESAAIMRALGDLGGAQALETLIQTLQGRFQSKHVFEDLDRQYAAESIGRIGGERADSVLLEFLRKQDLPVIQGGARYLIAAGHDGSDALLARALDPQNKTLRMLADLYLASDNPLLTSAAQAWARTQGLTISSETYKPVKWKQGTLPK